VKSKNPIRDLLEKEQADTPAKVKLVSYLRKKQTNLTDKEISDILHSIKRFVRVTHKIYKEPQAIVSYQHIKGADGKKMLKRVYDTSLDETLKVKDKDQMGLSIDDFRKLHKSVTKTKYD
jgi:hypothetical protein